jgi:uncharacterized caspase-like protein
MQGTRAALLIATNRYADAALRELRSPAGDAQALADVLRDHGSFDVRQPLLDEPHHVLSLQLEDFFSDREKDDLLLLYISCHGVLFEDGRLYFATSNTQLSRLRATAISAEYVNELMRTSAARSTVLLLDCCNSGAATRGMVAKGGPIPFDKQFPARGRIILTASSTTEYSWEGDSISGEGRSSVFTEEVVEGLRSRSADLDGDGLVTVQELYSYVAARVKERTPNQNPMKTGLDEQGQLVLASFQDEDRLADASLRRLVSRPAPSVQEFGRMCWRVGRESWRWFLQQPTEEPYKHRLRVLLVDERMLRERARGLTSLESAAAEVERTGR